MRTVQICSWLPSYATKIPHALGASLIPGRKILSTISQFGCRIAHCAKNAWNSITMWYRRACNAVSFNRLFSQKQFVDTSSTLQSVISINKEVTASFATQINASQMHMQNCLQAVLKLTRECTQRNPHLASDPVSTIPTLIGSSSQAPYWRAYLPYLLTFFSQEVTEVATTFIAQPSSFTFQLSQAIKDEEHETKTHTLLLFAQLKEVYESMMRTRKRSLTKDGFEKEIIKVLQANSEKLQQLEVQRLMANTYEVNEDIKDAIAREKASLATMASFFSNTYFIMKANLSAKLLSVISV